MHRLLPVLAFMMAGSAFAVDSGSFRVLNAADLVAVCSTAPDDPVHANAKGFCHGILLGAYRYYDSTVPAANRFVCAPHPVPTRTKVMNDFVDWAKAHPQYMVDKPVDTLFRYLAEAYPCKK